MKLIKQRATTGSLASYDKFEFDELVRFRQMYLLDTEETITGAEPFPGEMMTPKKINVDLPNDTYKHLVMYYKAAYRNLDFFTIEEISRNPGFSGHGVVVWPQINQFGRIRIGAEIFGSANAPRHSRSSFIRAKFVQSDDSIESFPGQIQYFFEHEVNLREKNKLIKQVHRLAYVRWFLPVSNYQTRFRLQITDDDQSCSVELWTNDLCESGRDSIIPVHNILDRFIPYTIEIGSRKPSERMAVIPLKRKFHM